MFKIRVQRNIGAALEAAHVFRDKLVGRGSYDRGMDHQVLEIAPSRLFLKLTHGRGLDIEHSHGAPFCQKRFGFLIIDRVPGMRVDRYPVTSQVCKRVTHHGKRSIAEQVNLHQAGPLRIVLVPGDHRHAFGRPLHRCIIGYRPRREHHPSYMHPQMPGESLHALRQAQDFTPRCVELGR